MMKNLGLLVLLCGALVLSQRAGRAATAALNDNFASAQIITGYGWTVSGDNTGCTKEAGEPNHAGNVGGASVWYRWTPARNGLATMSTDNYGTRIDTSLAVYTGSSVSTLSLVASNDDISSTNKHSMVTFQAVAGTTYQIAVDGFNDNGSVAAGTIWLSWRLPPANDDFANAQVISGATGRIAGNYAGGSAENGEPAYEGPSIWYRWTAPANGYVVFDSSDSTSGNFLRVYVGLTLTTLRSIGNNDPFDADSMEAVAIRGGSVLSIRLSGAGTPGDPAIVGDTSLSWRFIADAIAPTVTITRPIANSFLNAFNAIRGTVVDNVGGSGIKSVQVYIQRRSDGKFWDPYLDDPWGWYSTPTRIPAVLSTTDNTWHLLRTDGSFDFMALPYNDPDNVAYYLNDGRYTVQALATDNSNNVKTAITTFTLDQTPPTVSLISLRAGAKLPAFTAISGRAVDNTGGTGILKVELFIQRSSDARYWNGSTWTTTATPLPTSYVSGIWTRSSGFPTGANLLNGRYNLFARAFDRALNASRTDTVVVTVRKPASFGVVQESANSSTVTVSTATASAALSSIQLHFSGALEAESAGDGAHYSVGVNGHTVAVESAGYNASTHTVTLGLPAGALQTGDTVVVRWNGVLDSTGQAVSGQSGTMIAR